MSDKFKDENNENFAGSVILKVKEAKKRDYGRNFVRIDSKLMEKLKIYEGDFIALKGKKNTGATVKPLTLWRDLDSDIIMMDKYTRSNCSVEINDWIEIRTIDPNFAKNLTLTPLHSRIISDLGIESYIKYSFKNSPITLGDIINIRRGNNEFWFFKVTGLEPKGICLIEDKTTITILKDPIKYDIKKDLDFIKVKIFLDGNKSYLWDYLVSIYYQKDKYRKEIESWVQDTEIDPKIGHPWNYFGFALFKKRDYDKALEAFQYVIEIEQQNKFALTKIGTIYNIKKKYNNAIETFKQVINMDPGLVIAWINLGYAYLNKKKYDLAIEAYNYAKKIDPEYKEIWDNLCYAYVCKESYNKAIKTGNHALQIDSKLATSWNYIGFAYYKIGEFKKAMKHLKKAIKLDPKYQEALCNLALVLFEMKRYDNALDVCNRCLNIDPNLEDVKNLIVKIKSIRN